MSRQFAQRSPAGQDIARKLLVTSWVEKVEISFSPAGDRSEHEM
jgi:hypothetical protein